MNIDFKKLRSEVEQIETAGDIEKILNHDTCYNRFKATAEQMKDHSAINYMGRNFTYGEMLNLIDTAAKGFSELGIKENDMVTTSLLGTPYGVVCFYALDKLGACQHMVNCASGPDEVKREINHIKSDYFVANDIFCGEDSLSALKETGVKHVVTLSLLDGMPEGFNYDKAKYKLIEKLKGAKKKNYDGWSVLDINTLLDYGRNSNKEIEPAKYVYNHDAAIAYTSGSTGNSKACIATWNGMDSMVQVMAMTEQGRFASGDVMFTTFPLWIYYSLLNMIHEPLCLGVTLCFDPLFNPKDLARRNEQYQFNHWLTIPPYLKKFLETKKDIDCSKWKIVLTGGAELPDKLKIDMDNYIKSHGGNIELVQGYGASECLGSFAYCYYPNSTMGSMGKPCVGNMIKILDPDTLEEVKPGEIGEAYFYSPALMKGYYGDSKSTAKSLIKDKNDVIWYKTEDLVHLNDKNELFLDGRLKRNAIVKDNGGNYTKLIPERTKRELAKLDLIDKVEVVTVPDEELENKAIAYVVLKNEKDKTEITRQNIMEYSLNSVPEYMACKDVVFLDEIPLNTNGKPDFKKLEDMYVSKACKEEVKSTSKIKQILRKHK